ncbi:unnamed protein product [Malus baccata var. baccata]
MHTQNNMMAAPPSSSYRHIFLPEPKFVEQSLDPHSNRRKTGNRELRRVLTSSNMGFRFEAYDLSVKTLLYWHLQALSVVLAGSDVIISSSSGSWAIKYLS